MPVNRHAKRTVPADVRPTFFATRRTSEKRIAPQSWLVLAELDQISAKPDHLFILLHRRPVQPTDLVVLAISVVVAMLGSPEFITSDQHRYALRQHQCRQHIFDLTLPHFVNDRLVGWAFDAKVIAEIIVVTVAVVFTISQIVFVAVANEVVQGKTIVRRNEVNTAAGRASAGLVEVC